MGLRRLHIMFLTIIFKNCLKGIKMTGMLSSLLDVNQQKGFDEMKRSLVILELRNLNVMSLSVWWQWIGATSVLHSSSTYMNRRIRDGKKVRRTILISHKGKKQDTSRQKNLGRCGKLIPSIKEHSWKKNEEDISDKMI